MLEPHTFRARFCCEPILAKQATLRISSWWTAQSNWQVLRLLPSVSGKYKPHLVFGQPIAVETQMQVNYQLRPRNRRTALYALFRLSLGDGGGDPNQRATDYEMHFSRGRQKAVAH